ncbi:MAG TPA: ABC transporter ATP-binding protein [Dongiaceae bacterium]|jgi:peptide/nickel transport system ATP-binding protein|nr:ABC transporter ATP-binding protein [Dongiaceae bacterium]
MTATAATQATTAGAARPAKPRPILELKNVGISYMVRAGELKVVPDVSLTLNEGEALGLVGESGCGKSTLAYAIMRYLGGAGRLAKGQILFEGRDMGKMSDSELRSIRGSRMAMVYQDPMSSLNPVIPIGRQLMEVPMVHAGASEAEAKARALQMLHEVKLPDPETLFSRYPHQLSGGQQQRVVIAMALMSEPSLLVMDEPTTGLDVTVEAAVLDLVATLRHKHNTAIVFISHNLGTVVRICDRIGVMYAGELVEEGPITEVFRDPCHPYTRGLLNAIPSLNADKHTRPLAAIPGQVPPILARPKGCVFAPRCIYVEPGRCTAKPIATDLYGETGRHRVKCARVRELPGHARAVAANGNAPHDAAAEAEPLLSVGGLEKAYKQSASVFGGGGYEVHAVDGIDLVAGRGTTLAIVGESGCGKSTFAKVLTGIEQATGGSVRLAGAEIGQTRVEARDDTMKRAIQMVFQNPDSTLNPSHSIGYVLSRAIRKLRGVSGREARAETEALLDTVNLPTEFASRKPRQLSGGQKQRVAIARALAGEPELILADEPVSALDVSVQAAIVNLLVEIQQKRGATLLFISHDLSVVRYLADHVAVMYLGKVMEFGKVTDVFAPPYHPYTEALMSAVPIADPDVKRDRIILEGAIPSPTDRPKGCPFATRCHRKLGAICDQQMPPEQHTASGHRIACHIPLDELRNSEHFAF